MLMLYGREVSSRLLLGTARYPSPAVLADAVRASNTDILTISLRRETAAGKKGGQFFELIREPGSPDPAQHRRLPHGQGSGADGKDGPRCVLH